MKKISIVVPCYNEEENVEALASAIKETFRKDLEDYRYEIIFIDNDSRDRTREIIRRLCGEDKNIKGIFNAKNFGQFNSPYYGMLQSTGDCTILMAADFQDPVEMIPRFVLEWEYGYKIVIGIKTSSKESKLMYWLRGCYYKLVKKLSDVEQIEQFTGFGLYDAAFIQVLKDLDDPTPFLRGIVAELGFRRKEIPYEQPLRRAGKTSNNFYRLYDAAMLSITSYTKAGLRLATVIGCVCSGCSMLVAMAYLIMKLLYWDRFPAGMAPVLIGMCFLGSVQIFFIGMVGEYILSINQRVMHRPLVVEEERLNFDRPSAPKRREKKGPKDGPEWSRGPERKDSLRQPEPRGPEKKDSSRQLQSRGPEKKDGARQPDVPQQDADPLEGRTEGADRPMRRRRRKKPGSHGGEADLSSAGEAGGGEQAEPAADRPV